MVSNASKSGSYRLSTQEFDDLYAQSDGASPCSDSATAKPSPSSNDEVDDGDDIQYIPAAEEARRLDSPSVTSSSVADASAPETVTFRDRLLNGVHSTLFGRASSSHTNSPSPTAFPMTTFSSRHEHVPASRPRDEDCHVPDRPEPVDRGRGTSRVSVSSFSL